MHTQRNICKKTKINLRTKIEICILTYLNADVVCYSATRVWGSAVSSHSRVWGKAPAKIEFGAF